MNQRSQTKPDRNRLRGRRRKNFARRRGSALIATLFVVVAVSVLSIAYLQLSLSKNREGRASVDAKSAFYMAEAGISEAFTAIRMGRSGNIGTAAEPARFANGVFWVEAEEQGDGACLLRSTGLCGSGRSALAVVVDRTESTVQSLGVFGETEVTIGEGALVDSFDSRVGPFDQQGYDPDWYDERAAAAGAGTTLFGLLDDRRSVGSHPLRGPSGVERPRSVAGGAIGASLGGPRSGQLLGGNLLGGDPLGDVLGNVLGALTTDDALGFNLTEWADHAHEMEDAEHLPRSAKLTSNGDISILGTPEGSLPTRIFGSIRPGPEGTVTAEPGALVTGPTNPAEDRVSLPIVQVPNLTDRGDHTVTGASDIGNTEASYGVLQAPAGTTLTLEGPLTLVVEELWIEPGATLRIDTTGGPIEFYATEYFGLLDGSAVECVGRMPNDATFIVTADQWIDRDLDGQPDSPAVLSSTGELHAVVYAPDAAITLDADLRFFGSLAADRVAIANGAHVTFDIALESVSGGPLAIPRLGSWRLTELPDEPIVRSRTDPVVWLRAQGVTPPPPDQAYRDALLDVTFRCVDGHVHSYEGPKHLLDLTFINSIVSQVETVAPVAGRLNPPADDDFLLPTFGHAVQRALSPFLRIP